MRCNLATPHAFVKVVMLTKPTGLWDAKLTWYSLSATDWICLYSLGHSLSIHDFMLTWPLIIIKVLVTWEKFLEPSGYSAVINCIFTFHRTNIFWLFLQHYGPVWIHKAQVPKLLHIQLCGFQITWNKAMHTNFHNTTNHSLKYFDHMRYMP